ncbi:ThiF family adenylyltransferase [Thalassotalea maritima]|uniref:HesA/MoeB/ThiF family protein n=1 Tax=Thalassotalea maritima TaxID=3242416 RepID=UPI0035276D4D
MTLTDQEFLRYSRHIMMSQIGEQGQQQFKSSRVLIIGMGGLGCPAAQYLLSSGIGSLTLVDHDVIELSNLQRQVLYTSDDVGEHKVEAAKYVLEAMNPHCQLQAIAESVFDINLAALLEHIDIVLDCTDNPQTRQYINQQCVNARVKLVSASAIQGSGHLLSFDFADSESPCYQCLYADGDNSALNCSSMGVMAPLLGVMGSLQALEALRLLLGYHDNLNKVLLFDGFAMQFHGFSVSRNPTCPICNSR